MRCSFSIPVGPFSVNRMHSRDKRHKTAVYKQWERSILEELNRPLIQQQLKKFRESFVEGQHEVWLILRSFYPKAKLINQQNDISSRAEDLTNWEKPLVDLLFLPKFHVQPFPYGAPNCNTDDKRITKMKSSKEVSPDDNSSVQVTLLVRPITLEARP